jgi:hypothetical protein
MKKDFGGKTSNDKSKIPINWIDRDVMPQNFYLTAQVLYKYPVFENDVLAGHSSKKHESRQEGKQRVAKEKYDKFTSAENEKQRAVNKKQKVSLSLAVTRGDQQAASVDAQRECNNLMQRNQNLKILKALNSGGFDRIPGITDDDRGTMAQSLFQQLVPKGTLVEAFQKQVIKIDSELDSPSEAKSDDVEVVVPSPTPSPVSTQIPTSIVDCRLWGVLMTRLSQQPTHTFCHNGRCC